MEAVGKMSAETIERITADEVYAEAVERYGAENITVTELTDTYESMQAMAARKKTGVWYTPQQVAEFMSRFSLELGLRQVGPDAHHVLNVIACDPACGCGPFLVEAARYLATQYAGRLVGANPSEALVEAVLPKVILECVFGVDIDPTSVELAKLALSIETGGVLSPAALDRHVICGNALEGDAPPAMEDKRGRSLPMPNAA